jgi:hypothetical protein
LFLGCLSVAGGFFYSGDGILRKIHLLKLLDDLAGSDRDLKWQIALMGLDLTAATVGTFDLWGTNLLEILQRS